jgi:hypothetical protein
VLQRTSWDRKPKGYYSLQQDPLVIHCGSWDIKSQGNTIYLDENTGKRFKIKESPLCDGPKPSVGLSLHSSKTASGEVRDAWQIVILCHEALSKVFESRPASTIKGLLDLGGYIKPGKHMSPHVERILSHILLHELLHCAWHDQRIQPFFRLPVTTCSPFSSGAETRGLPMAQMRSPPLR